jgi:uncharacterized RDD family membrane protein YckC
MNESISTACLLPSRARSSETIRVSTSSGDWTTLVPVTGEAVALDLRLAQFPSRTLGLTLDLLVQLGLLLLLVWLSTSIADGLDTAAGRGIGLVAVVSVIVGLPTLVETLTRGRSLGKLATGQRVVRDDGGPVRFRHSFVRALFMIVDFWVSGGSVGLISSLASSRGKRLGDHFAGTVVIRQRVPAAASAARFTYRMPRALEGWAATLDLARLPDVTALHARQFLSRTGQLAPDVRTAMGLQLAAEVSTYVTPGPPSGTSAEDYLRAVLTERLRRASRPGPGASSASPPARSATGSRQTTPTAGRVDSAGGSVPVVAPTPPEPPVEDSGPFTRPR